MKEPPNETNATLYGKGVFTTVAVRAGTILLWEKHWLRLTDNAARVGIDLSAFAEESTRDVLDQAIRASGLADARARLTFFDESASEIWSGTQAQKTAFAVIVAERRVVPSKLMLSISPFLANSRSPLAGIKSCNYLEKILALDETKRRGFNEAIQLNERGEVTTAVMANVFWLNGDELFTPSLKTGCLAGTTREFVLENLECREVEMRIDELNAADSIFLTSAGLGVCEVGEFNGRQLAASDRPIKKLIA